MDNHNKTYFKELNSDEKISKLLIAVRDKVDFTVWEKKSKNRFIVKPELFFKDSLEVTLKEASLDSLKDKSILYHFSFSSLSFFGKAKLSIKDSTYVISCQDILFKSERRSNFRLLTYPHQKVFLSFQEEEQSIETSNVISMKTKQSETGLFKNFLNLMGSSSDKKDGSFRVLDLSVQGAALILGEYEKEALEKQTDLVNISIKFNGESIVIPRARIKYILNMIGHKDYSYKAGLEFIEVDTNLDSKLGQVINSHLRESESETEQDFEVFLK